MTLMGTRKVWTGKAKLYRELRMQPFLTQWKLTQEERKTRRKEKKG
jgi:hypothetical protein